jgi:predicted alpha/beta hydrolase
MRATDITLTAADGRALAGTVHEATHPRAAVVLAGATAVPARAYAALAETLASSGLTVLTFDYRGVAKSARGPVRAETATMADWGRLDLEGALGFVSGRYHGLPLLLLGHSVGGQLLGLAPTATALRGALLVGAQSGYWRNWDGTARLKTWLGWHLLLPSVTAALGYTPMRGLGMGENLPSGVGLQWARWGRHPLHLLSECSAQERERYARLGFPIRCYRFTDDDFAPQAAVDGLLGFYRGATTEVVLRSPKDAGAPSIGHFGWLKASFRETLWREMASWLLARADAVSGPQREAYTPLLREAPAPPEAQTQKPEARPVDTASAPTR